MRRENPCSVTRWLLLALSVSALAEAQLPSPAPEVAAQVVNEDRYPAHNVTFPNGVRGVPGAVYWEPDHLLSFWLLTFKTDLRIETSSGGRRAPLFDQKRAFRPALQICKNGMHPRETTCTKFSQWFLLQAQYQAFLLHSPLLAPVALARQR